MDKLAKVMDTIANQWVVADSANGPLRLHTAPMKRTVVLDMRDLRTLYRTIFRARVDSARTDIESLGVGDTVIGYPTRRVRIVTRLFVQMTSRGVRSLIASRSETEAMIAPDIASGAAANSAMQTAIGDGSGMLQQVVDVDSTVTLSRTGTMPPGLVLRSVTRTRTRVTGGPPTGLASSSGAEEVTHAEVISIRRSLIPDSVFAQPSGYTQVSVASELRRFGAALGGPDAPKSAKATKKKP
jgi:hypothetical protein